jgi:antitoxin HicB
MTIADLPLVFDPQPEGGFVVTCPLFPELVTEGETVREATVNANDALEAIIEAHQGLGRTLSFVPSGRPEGPRSTSPGRSPGFGKG